ncbi:hypothetical protein ACOME3_009195 [Neoechinorhynchus agilis]
MDIASSGVPCAIGVGTAIVPTASNSQQFLNLEIRGLIASKDAGAIFGRGGVNIKKLRSDFKTVVQIPDCDSPERLLIVNGEPESCYQTISAVFPLIGEVSSGISEFRLLVHQSQAGAIIGRKGDRVKDLRTKHNLDIKIFSECCPSSTERIVRLKGQADSVISCIREIHGIFEAQQAAPRGQIAHYDPMNHNEFMCPEYGGFSVTGLPGENMPRNNLTSSTVYYNTPDNQQQEIMMMDARRRAAAVAAAVNAAVANSGRTGTYSSTYGETKRDFGDDCSQLCDNTDLDLLNMGSTNTNSRLYALASSNNCTNSAIQQSTMSTGGALGYNLRGPLPNSTQVTIPNYLLPAILGPNGSILRDIKCKSGTDICIITAEEMNARMAPGAPIVAIADSVINIIGNDPAIQKAQYLLQQAVKGSGLWRS